MYTLEPLADNIVIEPIKSKDVKNYTGKVLNDVETGAMDILQYGRVIGNYTPKNSIDTFVTLADGYTEGDIVLYEKLASHKTNFGEPRLVLVSSDHIHAKLKETKDAN